MSRNWSFYFDEARPEDYRFLDFYNYRSQQTDFTFSFRKETDKLKKDLENLIINGSDKQKKVSRGRLPQLRWTPACCPPYSLLARCGKRNPTQLRWKPACCSLYGSFVDLRQRSGYYLDKTHFISKIENLNAQAILSLRPRCFSKTLFLSTLSSYYDIKNQGDQFKQLFGDLFISKNHTPLASSFLVLELNFARIRTSATYVIFEESFHKRLNLFMSRFMYQYQQELGHHFQIVEENSDALTNLLSLLNVIELCGYKLYICIDEYDASINEILRDETVIQGLTDNHKNENKTKLIESSFKQFYSCLKIACDRDIAYVFQTGVTPVAISEFTLGFNISTDLVLSEEFWDLHGFKQSEVELLLDNVLGNNLLSDVKKGIVKCYGEDSLNIIKKFLHFSPDLNALPSQTILELIGNNPLGKSILTEALNRSPLESRNGIEQRFRLTSIRELATDCNPEFIAEALKIYDWKEEDLIPVRSCLQILEAECNIEPLCRFVEETLLKPLKDNSVKHSNEEALKQSFMDTLILTLHANIEPEFQVNSQNSNLGNKAIDLVKTSTGGRIGIKFDNIRMEYINLNGAQGTWQETTQSIMIIDDKIRG
ncbi:DUF1703-domain-containing protein [Gigaspora margarita]|uniref:DUF1703-domain-containing protein n=1 Tax=Gigaspora margarita TaxID=4874 RepID=A0A8H4EJU1_GIGMA|nr:DUF1703-domain-containing protein [Gigaspora margarita]